MNHLKTLALCIISLILCCQVASATTITLNNNLSNDKINTSNLGQIKNQTNLQLINNQIHPQKTIHKKIERTVLLKNILDKNSTTNIQKKVKQSTKKIKTIIYKKNKVSKSTQNESHTNQSTNITKNTTKTIEPVQNNINEIKNINQSINTTKNSSKTNEPVQNNIIENNNVTNKSYDVDAALKDAIHMKNRLSKQNIDITGSLVSIKDIESGKTSLKKGNIIQFYNNENFYYGLYRGFNNGLLQFNFGYSYDEYWNNTLFNSQYSGIILNPTSLTGFETYEELGVYILGQILNTKSEAITSNSASVKDANNMKEELKKVNIFINVAIATIDDIELGDATLNIGDIIQLSINNKFIYGIYMGMNIDYAIIDTLSSTLTALHYTDFNNYYTGIKITPERLTSVANVLSKIYNIQTEETLKAEKEALKTEEAKKGWFERHTDFIGGVILGGITVLGLAVTFVCPPLGLGILLVGVVAGAADINWGKCIDDAIDAVIDAAIACWLGNIYW